MVTPFVRGGTGGADRPTPTRALEPVLRETHGVIVYHEQVMGVLAR
jgi:error-prone DNA polymerase